MIEEFFNSLLGGKIEVVAVPPIKLEAYPLVVAGYEDSDGKIKALCFLDLMAACYLGNALIKAPITTATNAIKNLSIPKELYDNTAEILNICTAFFHDAAQKQELRFKAVKIITSPTARLGLLLSREDLKRIVFDLKFPFHRHGKMLITAV